MRIATEYASISVSDGGGDGFPLVLLHGAGASKDVFARQVDSAIAQQTRLIAIDLPGHGDSGNAYDPSRGYSITGYAASVRQVLERLGIGRAAVVGWSLGGHVAIELMATSPLVAGLMLCGAPPVGRGPLAMLRGFQTSFDLLLAGKEQFTARDIDRFATLCFEDSGEPAFRAAIARADGQSRPVFQRSMMRGEGVDQRQAVEHADVPVAFVNGAREPFARLGYFSSVHCPTLWRNTCYVISGAGHAPFWQRPDAFNTLLGEFVADVEAAESARILRRVRLA